MSCSDSEGGSGSVCKGVCVSAGVWERERESVLMWL